MKDKLIPLVLFYGGRSSEHEISCKSARFVVDHLDRERFKLYLIAVDKSGNFIPQPTAHLSAQEGSILPVLSFESTSDNSPTPATEERKLWHQLTAPLRGEAQKESEDHPRAVVFGMIHGTGGEDGSLQGLCEVLGLPYIGPDVAGSSICMDKVLTKELAKAAGIPVVPYIWLRRHEWQNEPERWIKRIEANLPYPLFVKPATLGSSVGVSKVTSSSTLEAAVARAFYYDDKILIEEGLEVREIEFALLGGYEPEVSMGGEAIALGQFYSYESKYLDPTASKVDIPAKIGDLAQEEGRELARRIYGTLHLHGMARVDLFYTKDHRFILNEVNTIPGFTAISQYPALWSHAGVDPKSLLTRLIEAAQVRHTQKSLSHRDFHLGR